MWPFAKPSDLLRAHNLPPESLSEPADTAELMDLLKPNDGTPGGICPQQASC